MRNKMVFAMLLIVLAACTDQSQSPEDQVRQYIDRGIVAAEARNAGDLADMIDEHYRDRNGLDKRQLTQMLRFYFLRNKNIHLFKKIRQISFPSSQEADVTLYVAMAGSAISNASLLSSLRARIYRFELALIKPADEWLLQSARWQHASVTDIAE